MWTRSLAAILVLAATYDGQVAERLTALTRNSHWTAAGVIRVGFDAFHPQGIVKIGEAFFVSSVDKDAKAGHLFKIDASGRRIADLALTEGDLYHPGGIDFDGRDIWVPLAEYRPDSRSIVYRVDPVTMKAVEVVRVPDHIGAVVHNVDDRTLHGVSWGSRRFYRWERDGDGAMTRADNPSHYVDYQDCKYIGGRLMMCGGVADLRPSAGSPPFRLGGLDVVSLVDNRPVHQVPIPLITPAGVSMTQNAAFIEARGIGLRAYFMPEDGRSAIYIYDVTPSK
jgi:hypothetical protein